MNLLTQQVTVETKDLWRHCDVIYITRTTRRAATTLSYKIWKFSQKKMIYRKKHFFLFFTLYWGLDYSNIIYLQKHTLITSSNAEWRHNYYSACLLQQNKSDLKTCCKFENIIPLFRWLTSRILFVNRKYKRSCSFLLVKIRAFWLEEGTQERESILIGRGMLGFIKGFKIWKFWLLRSSKLSYSRV